MKRLIVFAALVVAVLTASVTAALGASGTSNWHVGYYTASNKTLSYGQAANAGLGSLNFTNQANTALLVTSQKVKGSALLGDMTGKTVTATATISGVNGAVNYYGEPDACGGTTAYVRYYFETSNVGGFNETHYWWSNPVAAPLANGPVTLALVSLAGANWSDYYGHFGNDPLYSAGFAAAVKNVTTIGLSFGGGCFFENGVGTDGSGTFTLNTYTAQ